MSLSWGQILIVFSVISFRICCPWNWVSLLFSFSPFSSAFSKIAFGFCSRNFWMQSSFSSGSIEQVE